MSLHVYTCLALICNAFQQTVTWYAMFKTHANISALSHLKHDAITNCFSPDKTCAASFTNGFKNNSFHYLFGVVILKINVV